MDSNRLSRNIYQKALGIHAAMAGMYDMHLNRKKREKQPTLYYLINQEGEFLHYDGEGFVLKKSHKNCMKVTKGQAIKYIKELSSFRYVKCKNYL